MSGRSGNAGQVVGAPEVLMPPSPSGHWRPVLLAGTISALVLMLAALERQPRRAVARPDQTRDAADALRQAEAAEQRGDAKQALHWLQHAAAQGSSRAQVRIGFLHQVGRGVPRDYAQALHWYQRAADQGDAEAQYHLGRLYEHGWGVPQSYARSLRWYQRAARQHRGQKAGGADQTVPFIAP
jgi:TPR repeat protein